MVLEAQEQIKPEYFSKFSNSIPKDAVIAFDGLERVIPSRQHSHNAAWVKLYKNMLINEGWKNIKTLRKDDTYEGIDVLIISLGIAYAGNINFFFGIDENVCWRFKRIQEFSGKIFVMNHDMPSIGSVVKPRLDNNSTSSKVSELKLDVLNLICGSVQRIDYISKKKNLIFGDSHCFSTYRPGYNVSRNDGLTLYGALKRGLRETIESRSGIDLEDVENLTLYMGNIDIRHHLCRLEEPISQVQKLAENYVEQACKLPVKNLELVHALPIENESRKLPKTGYYKGTPFYGSWEDRNRIHLLFNSILDRKELSENFKIFKWPASFKNTKNELDFEFMERPKSVHLSPLSYYWDLDNNSMNSLHAEEDR